MSRRLNYWGPIRERIGKQNQTLPIAIYGSFLMDTVSTNNKQIIG